MLRILSLSVAALIAGLILGANANGQTPKVVPIQVDPKQMEAAQAQLAKQLQAAEAGLTAQQKQVIAKLDKKQRQAAREQLNLMEVTAMRQAYVLLDTANADYHGHRAHAMHHLNGAIKNLEVKIALKGTTAQEQDNFRQEAIRSYYKSLRRTAPARIEPQMVSDAQVYAAGQILSQLRVVLALNNQKRNLHHIDNSLISVILALRTN